MNRVPMIKSTWTAALALLFVTSAWGDDHNRASMTLNEAGEVLRFVGESDNEPTAVLESGGGSTDILAFGDSFEGESVSGFGNIADLNDAGVAVMKVVAFEPLSDLRGDPDEHQYLVTSTNGGSPTAIAVATWEGPGSTTFGDSILCKIGPMPENNNAGQVGWFGALRASDATEFDCEDVDGYNRLDSFAFNQTFVEEEDQSDDYFVFDELIGGTGSETEADLEVGDVVTGSYFIGVDDSESSNATSAIFRYTPGSGHALLLEGADDGSADTIEVSDPRFVSSATTFEVLEVRYIRDGTQKMNAGGALLGFANLRLPPDDPRGGFGSEEKVELMDCIGEVSRFSNNPNDNPDGSEPYVRYRDIACGDRPDAIILFSGSSQTVVAMTGGESPYLEIPDEGHVLNNGGSVLFKAYGTDGLARLELYRPGLGTTTIAMQGDPLPTPGSDLFFCDFPPHYDLADDGSLAFQAEISNVSGADCEDLADDDRGFSGDGRTALFHYDSGQFTELMRTADMADIDTGPGPFQSTWSGNDITEISSVAISAASGLVQFFAENEDFEPTSCTAKRGSDDFGGGEWTAMLSWTPDSGLESVMEEGELLGTDPDDRIFRIYAMGPKLRAQANSSAELVALLDIDRNDDCEIDETDEMAPGGEQVIVIGRGTPPPGNVLEIPMAGPLGLGLFASALMLLSLMWVRSRTVGV